MSCAAAHPDAQHGRAEEDLIRNLFVRYSELLRSYIRRRVDNEADAAELVQEVWLRLMHHTASARLRESPESYLYRTASNLIRDQHRRRIARCADQHVPLDDDLIDGVRNDPELCIAARQLSMALEQAIGELSPKMREVFLLRLFAELSYREIQARTRIPLRSIERYMSQAMQYCGARLARQL